MARLLLLTPCVAAQVLMTETFDSPAGFTTMNANGNVPFFSDGNSDYFGIANGNGASTFSGTGPSPGIVKAVAVETAVSATSSTAGVQMEEKDEGPESKI